MRAPMSTCCSRSRLLNSRNAPQISTTDTATSAATIVAARAIVAARTSRGPRC